MSDPRIRHGGLWFHRSKHATENLSGRLGQARLPVFRNTHKRDAGTRRGSRREEKSEETL